MKKRILTTCALLVLLFFGGVPGSAQPAPTLTVGLAAEVASLDRNFSESGVGFPIYPAIFEYLVGVNPKSGQLIPMLAISWRSIDPQTWEFKLRQGVRFHNGEAFNAEAVKTTIEAVLSTPSVVRTRIRVVENVTIVDPFTVRFTTSEPYALLPHGLSQVAMYPPRYYKERGASHFASNPIGTGKFRFAEWAKGTSLTLRTNNTYWGTEKARIRNLVFRFIPETATRLAALERGEIDMAVGVPPDEVKRLESTGLRVAWSPIGQGMVVTMRPFAFPGTPLTDKRVRQALNYAVDKESLVKNIMLGFARPLDGQLVGPDAFGYNPNLKPYPYDPDRARRLLAEAGYPNGFVVKFFSSDGRYIKHREASEAVAGQLRQIGVRVEFEVLEWGNFVTRQLQTLDLGPMFYNGWNYFPVMDADFVLQHFASDSPFKIYSSGIVDVLFRQQRRTFDVRRRQEILRRAMTVIRDEAPVIFLFQSPDIIAVRSRVVGFQPTADNALHLDTVTVR